ncbi:MAG: DUF3419 family protein [Verrucomicrobia bacterium]|nr:DUF3419 family protein [Verrucomicrobiota bacterium]
MANFYERLSYSFGNEDWLTEQRALQLTPDDSVICITASGDRPLNLLTSDCKEILAIDANPIQNHLFHLKCAAIAAFDYDDYLAFMGLNEHPNRHDLFQKIAPHLPADSKDYWTKQSKQIAKGVIYQGTIERLLYLASRAIRTLRGPKVDELFCFDDLEKQRAFVQAEWDTPSWKKSIELVLNPVISRLFVKDPGLYLSVDSSFSPGLYIHQRMSAYLNRYLAKKSPLLGLLLKGKVEKEAFSPHLLERGTKRIRSRLNRITCKTGNFIDYLESVDGEKFDRFSVSDVASYLTTADFERLIEAIFKTAKPGARFCMRQFMSGYQLPQKFIPHFKRDHPLEEELQQQDNCFVYRFITGEIIK